MKTAIIGIGNIAPVHIQSILKAGREIIGLCDTDLNKALSENLRFQLNAQLYKDYRQMLDELPLDLVHICTPHYLHREMIIAALKRNINVLCEKPLCISEEEYQEIAFALEKSQAQLGVCLQNRHLAGSRFVHDYLQDKEIISAKAKVNWKRDLDYYKSGPWRGKWATEGGGVMINQAIHTLDLLVWFCGMPESIKGTVKTEYLQNGVEVETSAEFTLEGNYRAHFFATTTADRDYPTEIEINTKENNIRIIGYDVFLDGEIVPLKKNGSVLGKPSWGAGHEVLIKAFHDSVRTGEHFPVDIKEAHKALKLIWELYRLNNIKQIGG